MQTVQSSLRKRTKRIDMQILEVQSSVATLRARSATSRSRDRTLANAEPALVEDLRSRITAMEAELESLRAERLRLQRLVDSMENESESLPGYEERSSSLTDVRP